MVALRVIGGDLAPRQQAAAVSRMDDFDQRGASSFAESGLFLEEPALVSLLPRLRQGRC